MSKSNNELLSKFLKTEEVLEEANLLGGLGPEAKTRRLSQSSLSVTDLIKHNSNKRYASKNMAEEIVRWKSAYNQDIHEGECANPREMRLERLVKWINPDSQLMLEFENHSSRTTFDEIEERVFKLVKNELFGFLNFSNLDTYITIGENVFISRYIETDLVSTRDRFLIELDFMKKNTTRYNDLEYYERYSEIRGKDILVVGIKISKNVEIEQKKKSPKAIRVRSIRKGPEINV
ncbi:MAG: hypothetical protein HN576_10120 [Bacteriovoracaceae bacterium]|jgi:hypothetical protein|nr:hypothetical protein [Bacteriovoracaceae bacterium]